MIWLVAIALLILVMGPARPFIFANLRFFLPAAVGAGLGLGLASWLIATSPTGVPWPGLVMLSGAVAGFVYFGHGFKDWMDGTFNRRD